MHFSHHPDIWSRYPELAAGAIHCEGIRRDVDAGAAIARLHAMARQRLDAVTSESELPEIQAWRRVYSRMGLKPTQYRCASESLLRRFKKEGDIPAIHPLVDVCNAASMAYGIPVAGIDLDQVAEWLQVRLADGTESYQAFSGEIEHPEPGEVTFVDARNRSHARRWTNRQSGLSAIRDETRRVVIVCEAVHATASADVARLVADLAATLESVWGVRTHSQLLTAAAPRFAF
jgi:DNA/RNA-binding domain of Phe-tRNA-synthetase-like protein